jgi:hypothetical protein
MVTISTVEALPDSAGSFDEFFVRYDSIFSGRQDSIDIFQLK